MATNGLVVMTPSSIAYSGTSASINADGSVDFSAVTSLSLNGVFTSSYDNYMVTIRLNSSASTDTLARLRIGGTDNSTASSYVYQSMNADGTTVNAARSTQTYWAWGRSQAVQRTGQTIYLFGPNLSQPTAMRQVSANDASSARIYDTSGTHNQSTAYDGFTIYPNSGNFTGLVTVFGFNQ